MLHIYSYPLWLSFMFIYVVEAFCYQKKKINCAEILSHPLYTMSSKLSPPGNWVLSKPCLLWEANKWDYPLDETGKTDAPCHIRVSLRKIPHCSKVQSIKRQTKYSSNGDISILMEKFWKLVVNQNRISQSKSSILTEFKA
jgi:hypothetical protein